MPVNRQTFNFVLPALLLIVAGSAGAQSSAPAAKRDENTSSVLLHVLQQNDLPLAGAEVQIKGDKFDKKVRTDSAGAARLDGARPGAVAIRIKRVGFFQTDLDAMLTTGYNDLVLYVGEPIAALSEVRVTERRAPAARLEGFETRLKRGDASAVVTGTQIDKRNPVKLSTMLRGMPGLKLADSLGNIIAVSTRGQKLANGGKNLVQCVFRMSIDGIVLPPLSNIDQIIPKDVYGVEVFNGPSRIPPEMAGLRQDSWCGLIAIWTRSG